MRVYQKIVGSVLHIYVSLAGIDKKTLKVRTNSNMVVITAKYDERLYTLFDENTRIDIRIKLIRSINIAKSSVKFIAGVLHLTFDLTF